MYVRNDRTERRRSVRVDTAQTTPARSEKIAAARLRHIPCFTAFIMKDADHPRILELVLGRMLDLVVFSVEGVRDRFSRGRLLIH